MDIPYSDPNAPAVGVIGGSGLYEIEGFEGDREFEVETPFGKPSDTFIGGTLQDARSVFPARHGRGHVLAPHEINHRANIYAMRMLGVRWIICVDSCGQPAGGNTRRATSCCRRNFTTARAAARSRRSLAGNRRAHQLCRADQQPSSHAACAVLSALRKPYHSGGTYVNIDGPAFSTRAESEAIAARVRRDRHDDAPEAKLAREAEIALATLAMVTDYDCWRTTRIP